MLPIEYFFKFDPTVHFLQCIYHRLYKTGIYLQTFKTFTFKWLGVDNYLSVPCEANINFNKIKTEKKQCLYVSLHFMLMSPWSIDYKKLRN